ncbi:MAG: NosD domain-containing protein [Promethearchaeota archaeon]|jgi:parallel beta-helix repeat protein
MSGFIGLKEHFMARYKILIILVCILFIVGSTPELYLSNFFIENYDLEKKGNYALKNSDSWNLSDSPIFINDTDPNFSWSKIEADNDWCSGSGTLADPYLIENITIIRQIYKDSIEIVNSNVSFIIKNCVLENPVVGNWINGIVLDNVSNGLIANNSCLTHHNFGIYLKKSTNNTISNNLANDNDIGIYLGASSANNTVINNICRDNREAGLFIFDSHDNKVLKNQITNSSVAITVSGTNNTFSENILEGCGFHVRATDSYSYMGIFNEISTHFIDTTNLIDNKPVHYHVNQEFLNNEDISNPGQVILINCSHSFLSGFNISNSYKGIYVFGGTNNTISNSTIQNQAEEAIFLQFSNNNTVFCNRIRNSGYGIKCSYSHSNNLSLNEILNCYEGIFIEYSNYNNITGCFSNSNGIGLGLEHSKSNIIEDSTFNYNTFTGINLPYVTDASNNIIKRNLIQFNVDYGLYIMYDDPTNNLIYFNFFIDNGVDAYDYGTNTQWDNGTTGNYWYDYSGIDNNDDGIGDTPYNFGTGIDYFPIYRERPQIIVHLPTAGVDYKNPPNFTIEVSGFDLDTIWYTLNLGANKFIIQNNGSIDLTVWNELPDGNVIIRFYVNDTVGIYSYQEVIVRKNTQNITLIIVIAVISSIAVISVASIIVWKRKFSGKTLFVKDPEKIKDVKRKLLELGTEFEILRVNEIAESCGVLERSVISILKDMIKNNEIYAKYHKTENLVEFDQQLITQEIDQLMETYRQWEEREYGKRE